MSTANNTQPVSTWDQIKGDSIRLLNSLGKVVDQLADDFSKIMIASIESDQRNKMDQLVQAGFVETRGDALRYLVNEGINACQETFSRIETTNTEIDHLKKQISTKFSGKQAE